MGYGKALAAGPSWVRAAWRRYKVLPPIVRLKMPFLYFVLGGKGTPPFKEGKPDAFYLPATPIAGFTCASCPFAYEKVVSRGTFICSQVRGEIQPDAWCAIPHYRDVWRPLDMWEKNRVDGLAAALYRGRVLALSEMGE